MKVHINADIRVDTILVNGCLIDPEGLPLGGNLVRSDGVDYSGYASAVSKTDGKFQLAIRRGSTAKIEAIFPRLSTAVSAGPSTTDITLPACLTLQPSSAQVKPSFLLEPRAATAQAGGAVTLAAIAVGPNLTYQWLRNGQPIAGANSPFYSLTSISEADNNAQFSVRITNQFGSATSAVVVLTVLPGQAADTKTLIDLTYFPFRLGNLANLSISHFTNDAGDTWVNPALTCSAGSATGTLNGQAIPANTTITGSGTVAGAFASCASASDPDEILTGNGTVNYTVDSQFRNGSLVSQMSGMRRFYTGASGFEDASDLTGQGSVTTLFNTTLSNGKETTVSSITPSANTTLRNNTSGQTITYLSGTTRLTDIEPTTISQTKSVLEQDNVTYQLNGDTYVSSGTLTYLNDGTQFGVSGFGQIVLTRNNVQIGRIYLSDKGQFYESNGSIQPFSNAMPSPQSLRAKKSR